MTTDRYAYGTFLFFEKSLDILTLYLIFIKYNTDIKIYVENGAAGMRYAKTNHTTIADYDETLEKS